MENKFTASTEIEVNASPADVWEALTNPAMVKQYFFGVDLESSWEVGSSITYRGEWEGQMFEDKGNILAIEPQQSLVCSYWSAAFGTEDSPENYQKITYTLTEIEPGKTKLAITQEGSPTQESADSSKKNWDMVLGGLKELVEKD